MTFSSYSFGEQGNLRTSQGKIFDGLYANYTYDFGLTYSHDYSYAHYSGDLYNVTLRVPEYDAMVSWFENIQTRLISNSNTLAFGDGNHSVIWIFTDVSIGDLIPIVIVGSSDRTFNVTDELTVNYPGFGSLDIWVLEDMIYSTQVWYERSTGLLINGTFQRPVGNPLIFTLTDTNMFTSQSGEGNGIPSFEIFLVFPIITIISLIILMRKQKELRIKI
ncbi:MAG: hypothetical protein ACFFCE_08480 [Promethearchaeota archaeon]